MRYNPALWRPIAEPSVQTRRRFLSDAVALIGLAALGGCGGSDPTETGPLGRIVQSGHVRQRFGRASALDVAAYETKYKTRFSDAYRRFLAQENGLIYDFDFDIAKKAGVSPALADMNTFFGIGNGDKDNDLLSVTEDASYWSPRFVPFAPLIGLGGDFCTFAEINGGQYSGQIMYTDGEMYSGYAKTDFEGHAVDDLIASFIKTGWFMPIAASFDVLLADYAKMT